MTSIIYLTNGNSLPLDEFGTDMILKSIHKQELGNSLMVLHIADKTGKLLYTIPMMSIAHINYIEK
jgi:hypothetical protein